MQIIDIYFLLQANFSLYKCSPLSYSISDKKSHLYTVWAIPQDDLSLRIKKVMEGLRAEFGGPEIEPHIPFLGSFRMTHDDVLSKFRTLQSHIIYSFKAKVNEVATRKFYYQCVSLIIDRSNKVFNFSLLIITLILSYYHI